MSLYDKALHALQNAGIGLEGAADEATFGAYDKYVPGAMERGKEHNWMKNAGRVGSYFIPLPLPNKLKAMTRGPQALRELLAAVKTMKGAGGIAARGALGAAKGAAHGVATGEAQHAGRKVIEALPGGKKDEEAVPAATGDRLALEALFGVGGRAVGAGFKKLAPWVYNHPALLNKFKPKDSKRLARELLDEGTFGSLDGTFEKRAQKFKDEAKEVFDPLHKKISGREQEEAQRAGAMARSTTGDPTITNPKGMTSPKAMVPKYRKDQNEWAGTAVSRPERQGLSEAYQDAAKSLELDPYGMTTLDNVREKLKASNTRLTKLNARDRARAQGAQGLGENPADLDRLKSVRDAYEETYKKGIEDLGDGDWDTRNYNKAKKTHRKGADLSENLATHEILTSSSNPGFLAPDWFRNVARYSIGSAPIRTTTGVGLDRLAPKVPLIAGRTAELRSRKNGEQPIQGEPGQDLLFDLPPPTSGASEGKALNYELPPTVSEGKENPRKVSRGTMGIPQKELEAVKNMPLKRAKSEEWRVEENALPDENLLIKLPPPR